MNDFDEAEMKLLVSATFALEKVVVDMETLAASALLGDVLTSALITRQDVQKLRTKLIHMQGSQQH